MRRLDRRDGIDDVVDHMQKMFNQFQDITDFGGRMPVNMKEEDGKVIISADMPGVQKEDINLKADSNGLEISAESKEEIKEENEKYIRKERTSRRYRRKVAWPTEVDPKSVSADYSDGVLKIEAEKEPESENWDIEID
ncbi:MAG: heat-shock protein [Nanohaloarchaea archaeon SW_10_44_10]|nr:MAG: heat-shock protein [Nanohaloarchaea archaeon SW_10_44_10]